MILYHGTNHDFVSVDLTKSSPFKDFGRGFYLTDLIEQAQAMAKKRQNLFGGSEIVQRYEFRLEDAINDLNVLEFNGPTAEWADFIFKNRSRSMDFHHDYDIVYGPIANDGVAYLLGRYEEGSIGLDELAKELEYKKLNKQYFFANQKALEYLKRI